MKGAETDDNFHEPCGSVVPEWLGAGVWLSRAAQNFGDPNLIKQCRAAAERFTSLRDGETPEDFCFSSRLSGKARDDELRGRLFGEQRAAWLSFRGIDQCLQRDLHARLHFGTLLAFGDPKHAGAAPEWIPVRTWFYLHLDPDKPNVVRGEGIAYFYVRVIDTKQFFATSATRCNALKKGAPAADRILEHLVEWMDEACPQSKEAAKAECESISGSYPGAFERAWQRLPSNRKRTVGKHGPRRI